jgi:glucose uptake protein GlcU
VLQLVLFALHSSADCVPGVGGCRAALANGRVDAYAVKFIPQAVAGGVLWATGNTMAVPVISSIGLGMGMLIWGTTNMLMGWATGMARLDRNSASPGLVWLNVTGVGLALLALALYTLIRPDAAKEQPAAMRDELLLQAGSAGGGVLGAGAAMDARPARRSRRLSGILLALLSGILYGNNFTPPNLLLNTGQGPSNALDYVFSHFCGIYFASTVRMRACSHLNPDTYPTLPMPTGQTKPDPSNPTPNPSPHPHPALVRSIRSPLTTTTHYHHQVYMLAYCCYKRSTPVLYPRVILPGFLSGLMWAAAQTAWFVANASLSVAVAFPLITSGPGIVSSLWGVFVFKEITGRRNFIVLGAAISLAVTGCVLIGVAKAMP